MYRSKETLQQALLNKRKESYRTRPAEQKDKTTVATVPKGILRTYRLRGKMLTGVGSPVIGAHKTLGTSKEIVQ